MLYMAPEVARGSEYTLTIDVFSLGVVFFELFFSLDEYEPKRQ